jgi:hypothetical protein
MIGVFDPQGLYKVKQTRSLIGFNTSLVFAHHAHGPFFAMLSDISCVELFLQGSMRGRLSSYIQH